VTWKQIQETSDDQLILAIIQGEMSDGGSTPGGEEEKQGEGEEQDQKKEKGHTASDDPTRNVTSH
jgi:hypothetical protein